MVRFVWACALLLASQPALAMPRYEDYPAPVEKVQTPAASVRIEGPRERFFRTRIRRTLEYGVRKGANFAGHHVFNSWGCGGGCRMGAVVNLHTGKAFLFPHTVSINLEHFEESEWEEPIQLQPDSRLFIVRGILDETGDDRRFYYYFDDKKGFVKIADEAVLSEQ